MRKMLTIAAVLLSATFLMGQTWEIVREQSISFNPADVYFFDAQNGVLVGGEGAIYLTTDGAKTLTPVIAADPAVPNLADVHFADINNGFAVGDKGLILKTTDGGRNWIDVSDASVAVDLAGVAAISDQVAYVAGDDSTLLKTTDGGVNWVRSTYNFANADLDGGIAFYDADHGVVISDANGGDAWYTTDGGANWNYSPLAGYFPLGTTSSRLYDIDAAGTTFVVVGYHRTTFISTDNGQSWVQSGPFSYGYDRNMSVDVIDDNTI
ncbi:TPA: hypothetical protein DCG86_03725, partial [Candidatus Marinimicrobia bacterium]|nr:hypothetical protein [Candidatus Neomarinimicrobiota bacterium]